MRVLNHPIAGRVRYEILAKGALRLLDGWEAQNIGTVFIPQLKGVPTYGGKFSGNVRFYKPAIPQLKAAWEAVEAAGVLRDVIFWDGSFVPRLKRGGSSPSNHTVGTAFDINAEWNPFRRRPAAPGEKGSVWRLVPIFKEFGFECGAEWKNTPDGMHFEIEQLMGASDMVPTPPVLDPLKVLLNDVALDGVRMEDGRWVAPVRSVLDALGYSIERLGDHRERGRFYIYAKRTS